MRIYGRVIAPSPAIPVRQLNPDVLIVRIVYIVSLFPCWSETFIVREITEMIRLGADVQIVSLKNPSEEMIQSDARGLLGRVVYPSSGWQSFLAVLREMALHPMLQISDLAAICRNLAWHPGALAKTLVVWWRSIGMISTIHNLAPSHIHAHWATYPSTAAMLLSKRLNIPYSFTAHAHDIFLEDHLLSDKLRTAKFAVAISAFNKQYLCERVAGAENADIKIVHCGVSLPDFPVISEGRDRKLILTIGRLDDIKGFPYLVEACGILHAKGVEFHCEIVGSGPLQASLAARIEALGLASHVRLLGARKQEEVRQLLHHAGIFALPCVVTSRGDRDGIPVALMEAMASGLPVISTGVSGVPELVEDGVTGLLAESRNAADLAHCLERLLTNDALVAELLVNARHRVEQEFDVQKEALKLHDAIASQYATPR